MTLRYALRKITSLVAVCLLAGCDPGATPLIIGEINAIPSTTVTTGETASLTIPASGTNLKFEWQALRGNLSDPTRPAVVYTAPDLPGPDVITVKIIYSGGEVIKSINFDVVSPPSPTPIATDTPVSADTPTPTTVPKPIACNNVVVTKNLFPQLADESGQFPIYGPVTETRFLCQAVYDIVHTGPMAVHIKFESFQDNFGWWGVATPNGYNAATHNELCLWAYAKEPNQSFRLKMKDTAKTEKGTIITIEKANEWQEVCTEVTKFVELGIKVDSLDNVNLGFETPTGSAEIWVADLEFK